MFKNSVRTSKRTPNCTIKNISWLILFKEIIAVYNENHTKLKNIKYCVTDCYESRDIQLPLGFEELMA
jgi:hypothetical protein